MQTRVGTMVCKFDGDPLLFVVEEAIFVKSEKCPYHVIFDLDLEHILDGGLCWGPSCASFGGDPVMFVVEVAIFCASFGGDPVMFVVEVAIFV